MPLYSFICPRCGWGKEKNTTINARLSQLCGVCSTRLKLKPAAPMLLGFDDCSRSVSKK